MPHRSPVLLIVLLAALWVGGCAAVDVRVESLATLTPAPSPTAPPPPTPAVQAEFNAGLVAREAPDDSAVRVFELAAPHLIYQSDGSVMVEMMPEWVAERVYFVVNTGRGVRLRLNWRAVWLAGGAGNGRVGMDVYLRTPDSPEFQWVETASTADFYEEGVTFREELLDSTLYLPAAGEYVVRADLKAEAWNDAIGAYADGAHTHETTVVALNQPDDLVNTLEGLSPAFGELEAQGVFLDWRGWRFGPCFVRAEGNPEFTRLLDEACSAFEGGDWESAANALQDALNTTDDPSLHNRLRQQLGTIAAAAGRWNVAVRHFTEGERVALGLQDALEVAIAQHNLGVGLIYAGFGEQAEPYLWQSLTLYDQMEDWVGATVAWGQFAVYWQDPETFEWVVPSLYESGLPQAAALDALWGALGTDGG
jgi:hypothetical protein